MTRVIDYNPERWWWHMAHTWSISERTLKGVKTHSLVRMLENQEAYVRAAIKHRWDNRKPGEEPGLFHVFSRNRGCLDVLRRLRAEMKKRQNTAPVPKHNHGKGIICPLMHPPEREGGRLSA